jgi:hypothetical protein
LRKRYKASIERGSNIFLPTSSITVIGNLFIREPLVLWSVDHDDRYREGGGVECFNHMHCFVDRNMEGDIDKPIFSTHPLCTCTVSLMDAVSEEERKVWLASSPLMTPFNVHAWLPEPRRDWGPRMMDIRSHDCHRLLPPFDVFRIRTAGACALSKSSARWHKAQMGTRFHLLFVYYVHLVTIS